MLNILLGKKSATENEKLTELPIKNVYNINIIINFIEHLAGADTIVLWTP